MNPRGTNQPNIDPRLHPARAPERSLAESLGSVVDEANQLAVDLGMRPYRVFSVTYVWSGGAIGLGTAKVHSIVEWLPTPIVSSMTAVSERHRAGGTAERGVITVTQISPRYTEAQLEAMCGGARECRGPEFETFVEVAMDRRDGDDVVRRRFTADSAFFRDVDGMAWRVNLMKQDENRSEDGTAPNVARHDPYTRSR